MNEVLVLFCFYFLFIYSDGLLLKKKFDFYIKNREFQEDIGRAHVGLLLLMIAINLTVMAVVQVRLVIKLIKRTLAKRTE